MVVHEPWHRHRPQSRLITMGSPRLQKRHPTLGWGCNSTKPQVLWRQSHCWPSTQAWSPRCPGAQKRHLLPGKSHNLWSALREADHELQQGDSGCRSSMQDLQCSMPHLPHAWLLEHWHMQCSGPPTYMCFWEEEPWFIRCCPRDEYVTAVVSLYVRGGVPPPW
jgi:hypothetical protein